MLIDNQKGSEVLVNQDGTYKWVAEVQQEMMNLDS